MTGKLEYGDYQTPAVFAERVCCYLKKHYNIEPSAIIEPTCGIGAFLKSSLEVFNADEYYGIEINPEYCKECGKSIKDERIHIINSDFFSFSLKSLVKNIRQILIVGNPPWVTNSTLTSIGSDNLPKKANFKGLKGLDALTGSSNFDICEYIILQLVKEYNNTNTMIAMLCKTSVARNVFKELKRSGIFFSCCDVLEFDATKIFGINASACLFVIKLQREHNSPDVCNVYDFETPETIKSKFGYLEGRFYSNLGMTSAKYDGSCCFEWRQGVKHDCSKIMELSLHDGKLQNGQNENVDIEPDMVFPLIKSSMFHSPIIHKFSKFVIMTQKKVREETKYIEQKAPKTWKYLNDNIECFQNRKSSIYKGAPQFSMFGVGDYSYSQYKVGVSGFYKRPLFSVLYSEDNKPVMTDDTTYFICFNSFDMAYIAMLLLNSSQVQDFLFSIAFQDAKRPYTKKVLERIDFSKIISSLTFSDITNTENSLNLSSYVSQSMYEEFKSLIGSGQLRGLTVPEN